LRRIAAAPAILAGVYVVTLLAALPLALSLRDALQNHLGSSLAAGEAADGRELRLVAGVRQPGNGHRHLVHADDHRLRYHARQHQRLLDGRAFSTPIVWGLGVYLAAWMFVTGGVLDRYARGRRVGAFAFFAACGTFFFRFVRLGIAAAVTYGFLFIYVHDWLFAKWYVNITRDIPSSERSSIGEC
jgi:hypothetical protein